jgi:hypothetical protein
VDHTSKLPFKFNQNIPRYNEYRNIPMYVPHNNPYGYYATPPAAQSVEFPPIYSQSPISYQPEVSQVDDQFYQSPVNDYRDDGRDKLDDPARILGGDFSDPLNDSTRDKLEDPLKMLGGKK